MWAVDYFSLDHSALLYTEPSLSIMIIMSLNIFAIKYTAIVGSSGTGHVSIAIYRFYKYLQL